MCCRGNMDSYTFEAWRSVVSSSFIHSFCDCLEINSCIICSIMRPGTLHAVLTSEHCLATGGHFYSRCTMADTLRSQIIEHYYGCFITNTEHDTASINLFKVASSVLDTYTNSVLTSEQRACSYIVPLLFLFH